MRIIVDYDSTIARTHEAVLELYREMTGDFGTEIDDEKLEWDMGSVCRQWTPEKVNEVFTNPRLFDFMQPFDRCIRVLKMLKNDGHKIEVCSIHKEGAGKEAKFKWLEKNIPFLNKITILTMIEGMKVYDKSSVDGDIIVDDRIDCILTSPCKYKILFGNYTWNKDFDESLVPNCYRANDWIEVFWLISVINTLREKGTEL